MTALGLGAVPRAPGTAGSLLPVALVLAALRWGVEGAWLVFLPVGLGITACVGCLWLGAWAEDRFGAKDPRQVVLDEVAGQCLVLVFLPWRPVDESGAWSTNLLLAGGAFVAFRLFDIAKPPPIGGIQRWGGGLGILADDLVAGAYALVVMLLAVRLLG